jgi:hypothetical protein
MSKLKRAIGIISTLLFGIALIGLLYSFNPTTGSLSYNVSYLYEEFPQGVSERIVLPIILCIAGGPFLLLLLIALIIWGIKKQQSLSLRHVGEWLWSHAYFIISFVAVAYLVIGVSAWLWFGNPSSPFQSMRFGEPSTSGQGDYIAVAELTAPNKIRFGSSSEVDLKIWIIQGIADAPCLKLRPDIDYKAQVSIQAINFEIDAHAEEFQSTQTVTVDQPAIWKWVVTPKEERLGTQHIAIKVNLLDQDGNPATEDNYCGLGDYLSLTTTVTDPLGLPPAVMYGVVAFGGVLGAPFWAWLYNEWSSRQKEKREQQRKFEGTKDDKSK